MLAALNLVKMKDDMLKREEFEWHYSKLYWWWRRKRT